MGLLYFRFYNGKFLVKLVFFNNIYIINKFKIFYNTNKKFLFKKKTLNFVYKNSKFLFLLSSNEGLNFITKKQNVGGFLKGIFLN